LMEGVFYAFYLRADTPPEEHQEPAPTK
jgi:hypothetical protein